ncbi:Centrosomal protein of 295 kDa [Galemys pyrenaicus]|uniref:Centrosomal protein of 295 kDa n=1 Tax=Galemys pyrenaicus TaxID=202257 RepID=A0A8J6DVJ4_GALPY|nr:Centrosomal protein of 295 kDa [Galemys pyrenaicus]
MRRARRAALAEAELRRPGLDARALGSSRRAAQARPLAPPRPVRSRRRALPALGPLGRGVVAHPVGGREGALLLYPARRAPGARVPPVRHFRGHGFVLTSRAAEGARTAVGKRVGGCLRLLGLSCGSRLRLAVLRRASDARAPRLLPARPAEARCSGVPGKGAPGEGAPREPDLNAPEQRAAERKRKAEVRHKEALKVQKDHKEMLTKEKTW